MTTTPHGTTSRYTNQRCRCAPCTAAHTTDIASNRAIRRARTAANGGTAPIDRHGTESTYTNWSCRCDPCRLAHNAYKRGQDLSRRTAQARP